VRNGYFFTRTAAAKAVAEWSKPARFADLR